MVEPHLVPVRLLAVHGAELVQSAALLVRAAVLAALARVLAAKLLGDGRQRHLQRAEERVLEALAEAEAGVHRQRLDQERLRAVGVAEAAAAAAIAAVLRLEHWVHHRGHVVRERCGSRRVGCAGGAAVVAAAAGAGAAGGGGRRNRGGRCRVE